MVNNIVLATATAAVVFFLVRAVLLLSLRNVVVVVVLLLFLHCPGTHTLHSVTFFFFVISDKGQMDTLI